MDDQSKEILSQPTYDYESVPALRRYKIEEMHHILKENVNRKYKISYYKGFQLFFESLVIFILTISLIMKANIWSIVYLLFVFRFACTRNKTTVMVRLCAYLSITMFAQYILYWLNMTNNSSA